MSNVTDLLQQVGGTLGTIGSGVATYLATQIRSVRESARKAQSARQGAERALATVELVKESVDNIARGIRLEVEHFRNEMSAHRPQSSPAFTLADPSAPTLAELGRRLEELSKRIEECNGDIKRERGARHALQQNLADGGREDERQWREFHRILGEIQGELRGRGR